MSPDEILSTVKKYKLKSVKILMGFLAFAIAVNWYFITSGIERQVELGLPYVSSDSGFIWGVIITGLYTVLYLCFYSIENILLELLIKPKEIPE